MDTLTAWLHYPQTMTYTESVWYMLF